jgi:hypothetical protein
MSYHKNKAEEILSTDDNFPIAVAAARIAQSQVHATLYLAEQQRIANLIAYYALVVAQEAYGTMPSHITSNRLDVASNQIIEGLGL